MEWISCKDRLPEEEGAYWCYIPSEKYIQQKVFFCDPIHGFNYDKVTHWMRTSLCARRKVIQWRLGFNP